MAALRLGSGMRLNDVPGGVGIHIGVGISVEAFPFDDPVSRQAGKERGVIK